MKLLKRSRNHVQRDISAQVKVWIMDIIIHVLQEQKAINLNVFLVLLDTIALMIKCNIGIMKILCVITEKADTVKQARDIVIFEKISAAQSVKQDSMGMVMFFDDL